jgi:hypothetical protein
VTPSVSASLKIPMPLRVPELAPSLGKLVVPSRLAEPWIPIDDIREGLATRVMDLAGNARAAAEREEREQVLEVLGRRAWLAAWEQAVRRTAERASQALDDAILRHGHSVRMTRREMQRRLLSGGERRAVAARFGSGAERFVAALDALDGAGARVREATVLDKDAHAEWQEALRTAARRLEAAWLALEDELAKEEQRWAPELAAVAGWKPSIWPVLVVWAPVAGLLVWLGLVLGGYLPAPEWLALRLGF